MPAQGVAGTRGWDCEPHNGPFVAWRVLATQVLFYVLLVGGLTLRVVLGGYLVYRTGASMLAVIGAPPHRDRRPSSPLSLKRFSLSR